MLTEWLASPRLDIKVPEDSLVEQHLGGIWGFGSGRGAAHEVGGDAREITEGRGSGSVGGVTLEAGGDCGLCLAHIPPLPIHIYPGTSSPLHTSPMHLRQKEDSGKSRIILS